MQNLAGLGVNHFRFPMKKGDLVSLKIEDVTFGSEGLARTDGKVVFVPGALPEEVVEARIIKKKKDFARARVISFREKSLHRCDFPCAHFPVCGGCKWQDVAYDYQLELKRHIVAETLRRLGGFGELQVLSTLASDEIFHYRNKMEFSFSAQRWILPDEPDPLEKPKDFALGLHIPGRYDKVLDVDTCWLQSETGNRVLRIVKDFARESGLSAWDTHLHEGFWRYLVIREGKQTGETMVNIVTFAHEAPLLQKLADKLLQQLPQLTGIVNNVTTSKGGSAFGEKEYLLAGKPTINEKIGGHTFEISANSFFQTNPRQAERLYQKALDLAGLTGNEIVYDLYSGTGTISLFLSDYARHVIGVEVIESAVKDARNNALKNGVGNCSFVLGDVREEFRNIGNITEKYGRPDVLVLDPPRAGVHPKSLAGILALNPQRIVYISCNPATFARDAQALCRNQYHLQQVQPVDMFPHTYHVELVAKLERR